MVNIATEYIIIFENPSSNPLSPANEIFTWEHFNTAKVAKNKIRTCTYEYSSVDFQGEVNNQYARIRHLLDIYKQHITLHFLHL